MLPPVPTPLATLVITLLLVISKTDPVAVIDILPPSARSALVVMLLFTMLNVSPNTTLTLPAVAVTVPVLLAEIVPPLIS